MMLIISGRFSSNKSFAREFGVVGFYVMSSSLALLMLLSTVLLLTVVCCDASFADKEHQISAYTHPQQNRKRELGSNRHRRSPALNDDDDDDEVRPKTADESPLPERHSESENPVEIPPPKDFNESESPEKKTQPILPTGPDKHYLNNSGYSQSTELSSHGLEDQGTHPTSKASTVRASDHASSEINSKTTSDPETNSTGTTLAAEETSLPRVLSLEDLGLPLYSTCDVSTGWSCRGSCGQWRPWPCSCDVTCHVYRRCCEDMTSACPQTFAENLRVFLGRQISCVHSVQAVSSCVNDNDNNDDIDDEASRCTSSLVLEAEDIFPVHDPQTRLVFRNIHCARCNGVNTSTALQIISRTALANAVKASSISEVRNIESQQLPRCFHSMITQERVTSYDACPGGSDPSLRKQCEASTSYVFFKYKNDEFAFLGDTRVFKNRFCFTCWQERLKLEQYCWSFENKWLVSQESLYQRGEISSLEIGTLQGTDQVVITKFLLDHSDEGESRTEVCSVQSGCRMATCYRDEFRVGDICLSRTLFYVFKWQLYSDLVLARRISETLTLLVLQMNREGRLSCTKGEVPERLGLPTHTFAVYCQAMDTSFQYAFELLYRLRLLDSEVMRSLQDNITDVWNDLKIKVCLILNIAVSGKCPMTPVLFGRDHLFLFSRYVQDAPNPQCLYFRTQRMLRLGQCETSTGSWRPSCLRVKPFVWVLLQSLKISLLSPEAVPRVRKEISAVHKELYSVCMEADLCPRVLIRLEWAWIPSSAEVDYVPSAFYMDAADDQSEEDAAWLQLIDLLWSVVQKLSNSSRGLLSLGDSHVCLVRIYGVETCLSGLEWATARGACLDGHAGMRAVLSWLFLLVFALWL